MDKDMVTDEVLFIRRIPTGAGAAGYSVECRRGTKVVRSKEILSTCDSSSEDDVTRITALRFGVFTCGLPEFGAFLYEKGGDGMCYVCLRRNQVSGMGFVAVIARDGERLRSVSFTGSGSAGVDRAVGFVRSGRFWNWLKGDRHRRLVEEQIFQNQISSKYGRTDTADITVVRIDEQTLEDTYFTKGECLLAADESCSDKEGAVMSKHEPQCVVCGCEDNESFQAMINPCNCNDGSVMAHPVCVSASLDFFKRENSSPKYCMICGSTGTVNRFDLASSQLAEFNSRTTVDGLNLSPKKGLKRGPSDNSNGGLQNSNMIGSRNCIKSLKEEDGKRVVHEPQKDGHTNSEANKQSVTLPVRRFDDAVTAVPIKKRKLALFQPPSPPNPSNDSASSFESPSKQAEAQSKETKKDLKSSEQVLSAKQEHLHVNSHNEENTHDRHFSLGIDRNNTTPSSTEMDRKTSALQFVQTSIQRFLDNDSPPGLTTHDTLLQTQRDSIVESEMNLISTFSSDTSTVLNHSNKDHEVILSESKNVSSSQYSMKDKFEDVVTEPKGCTDLVLGPRVGASVSTSAPSQDSLKKEKGILLRLNSGYLDDDDRSCWDLNAPMETWETLSDSVVENSDRQSKLKISVESEQMDLQKADSIPVDLLASEGQYKSENSEQDMLIKGFRADKAKFNSTAISKSSCSQNDLELDISLKLKADSLFSQGNDNIKISKSSALKSVSIPTIITGGDLNLSVGFPCDAPEASGSLVEEKDHVSEHDGKSNEMPTRVDMVKQVTKTSISESAIEVYGTENHLVSSPTPPEFRTPDEKGSLLSPSKEQPHLISSPTPPELRTVDEKGSLPSPSKEQPHLISLPTPLKLTARDGKGSLPSPSKEYPYLISSPTPLELRTRVEKGSLPSSSKEQPHLIFSSSLLELRSLNEKDPLPSPTKEQPHLVSSSRPLELRTLDEKDPLPSPTKEQHNLISSSRPLELRSLDGKGLPPSPSKEQPHFYPISERESIIDTKNSLDTEAKNFEIPVKQDEYPIADSSSDKQVVESMNEKACHVERFDAYEDDDAFVSDIDRETAEQALDQQVEEGEYREADTREWMEEDAHEDLEDEHVDYGDSDFRDNDDIGMELDDRGKYVENEKYWNDDQQYEMEEAVGNQQDHMELKNDERILINQQKNHASTGPDSSEFPPNSQSNKLIEFKNDSSRSKSSGWDKLPEGYQNAEDALKAVNDIIGKQGQGTGWTSGGRTGIVSSRGSSSRNDGVYKERVESENSFRNRDTFYRQGRDDGLSTSPNFASRRPIRGRFGGRGGLSRGRGDYWVDGGRGHWNSNRQRSPEYYGDHVSYGHNGSANAAAMSAAKVQSSGFYVATDGTLSKVGRGGGMIRGRRGRCSMLGRGSQVDMEENMDYRMQLTMDRGSMISERTRDINIGPDKGSTGRHIPRERYRDPAFVDSRWDNAIGDSPRRVMDHHLRERNRSFSPPIGRRMRNLPRSHTRSRSRSRTRSPRTRISPRGDGSSGFVRAPPPRRRSRSPIPRSDSRPDRLKSSLLQNISSYDHKGPLISPSRNRRSPPPGSRWSFDRRDSGHFRNSDFRRSFRSGSPSRRMSPHGGQDSIGHSPGRYKHNGEFKGNAYSSRPVEFGNDSRRMKRDEDDDIRSKPHERIARFGGTDRRYRRQDDDGDCQGRSSNIKEASVSKEQDQDGRS